MHTPRRVLIAALIAWSLFGHAAPAQDEPARARATPVPFPETAPAIPREAELERKLQEIEGFLELADRVLRETAEATERYRTFVQNVQRTLAECQIQADLAVEPNNPFRAVMARESEACRRDAQSFRQRARTYATQLDAAQRFAVFTRSAHLSLSRRRDTIVLMRHSQRLMQEVDRGFDVMEQSKRALQPWMED